MQYILQSDIGFQKMENLSEVSNISLSTISSIIHERSAYYREFEIPKRTGGHRKLMAPAPALKKIQSTILSKALNSVKLSEACHSYTKNKSIITNAKAHVDSKSICRIDIRDFFPSIRQNYVFSIFEKIGFDASTSAGLSVLCTLSDSLPQGAPSSPAISNISLIGFDEAMIKFATSEGLIYSRYADDIYISGQFISKGAIAYTKKTLEYFGFESNDDKTLLMTEGRKVVTGLSVSSGKVCVPRKFKRKLRDEAFRLTKINSFENLLAISEDPFYVDRILGRLEFWKNVEPDNLRAIDLSKAVKEKVSALVS